MEWHRNEGQIISWKKNETDKAHRRSSKKPANSKCFGQEQAEKHAHRDRDDKRSFTSVHLDNRLHKFL